LVIIIIFAAIIIAVFGIYFLMNRNPGGVIDKGGNVCLNEQQLQKLADKAGSAPTVVKTNDTGAAGSNNDLGGATEFA
jgi:uncharacterized protein YneF (UPF0154 family)